MRNRRGQALVEFVLILPVLLLLIFTIFDFGRIFLCKMHLESVMNEVSSLEEDKIANYLKTDDEYKINYSIQNGEYKVITLETKLDLITPGLKNVLSNPYVVKVERSLYE